MYGRLKIGLLVLGGFALVAISAYAGYWYASRQQAAPTAGWKTYTSTRYNFTLNYPPDLYVQIEGSDTELEPDKVVVAVRLAKSADIDYPIVDVSVTESDLTPEEWIKANRCGPPATLCLPISTGVIPGSLQVQTSEEVHYQSVDTVFKQNSLLLDISVNATNPDWGIPDSALTTYNQILSTFKFLE